MTKVLFIGVMLVFCFSSSACSPKDIPAEPEASEPLAVFRSAPARDVRDCIFKAAGVEEMIADYDELDRDFLILYASQLTLQEFSVKTKGAKVYADDLSEEAMERLLAEAKLNRDCRTTQSD